MPVGMVAIIIIESNARLIALHEYTSDSVLARDKIGNVVCYWGIRGTRFSIRGNDLLVPRVYQTGGFDKQGNKCHIYQRKNSRFQKNN